MPSWIRGELRVCPSPVGKGRGPFSQKKLRGNVSGWMLQGSVPLQGFFPSAPHPAVVIPTLWSFLGLQSER